jgi:hypothetical protein
LVSIRRWPALLESDCYNAVHAITDTGQVRSSSWSATLEARELLKMTQDIAILKIERSCNKAAHVLAQLGKSRFSGCLRDSAPDCVRDLIAVDCMNTM